MLAALRVICPLLVLLTLLPPPPAAGQTPPAVEDIRFTPDDGEVPGYGLNEIIKVTVTFSEAVVVTGTPRLALPIGSATRYATYQSGSSSATLVFHYTVQNTDEDIDGVALAANPLELNGGSIKSTTDLDANLTHEQTRSWPLTIDGIVPLLQTAAVYDNHLVLTYSEPLWKGSATPASAYAVQVNTAARAVTKVAISGRTVTLTLASAVGTSDQVTVGYTVGTHPVRDQVDNNAAALSAREVTTSAPSVSRVAVTSTPAARQTYAGGEVIEITVTFSEEVTVTGTPTLQLLFDSYGSYPRDAQYASGSGTTALVFRYVVSEGINRGVAFFLRLLGYNVPPVGDEDPDGLSITATALHLNDGTIRDSDNHDAWLKLAALTNAAGHKVDGGLPTLVPSEERPLVVNGATLTVRYNEPLDKNSVPPSSAFTVTVNDAPTAVDNVAIADRRVTMTLATPVRAGDTVQLSYTVPTSPIRDAVGNSAEDFYNRSVRNDTPSTTTTTGGTTGGGGGGGSGGSGGGGGGGSGGGGGGGSGGGGGGGGGGSTPDDRHGDTPEDATSLNPRRYTTGVISRTLTAHLQSRRDIDYFTLDLPYAGILTASTTGADTTGRLYQAQDEGDPLLVAADTDSGRGSNFALGTAVETGTYYLAVLAGRGSGEYRLSVHYTPAFVDNPGPDSPQSGVSVLSGWVCDADTVAIEFETPGAEVQTLEAATGTSRLDTAAMCGPRTTDTGYGLLFNWNRLGDGEHTVRVLIDDILLAERQITVTTLGDHPDQEFRRDLPAITTDIPDFPAVGETTTLRWQTARQNFVIAHGAGGGGGQQLTPEQAILGNPAPGSFQSGIGVLSGWVCEAETVELGFEPATGDPFTEEAGYGTERSDTEGKCGDTDNGFGVLFNWNRLGDGQHTVRAYADNEAFAHSTFTVTTLGEEFAEGLARTHEIEDFPAEGQTTTVEWQQGQQNFVITAVE